MNFFKQIQKLSKRPVVLYGGIFAFVGILTLGFIYVNEPSAIVPGNTYVASLLQDTANAQVGYKKLSPGTTWQWQLTGTINETILDAAKNPKKMMDVDMETTSPVVIKRLKAKNITVICYMEVGAWEEYRTDAGKFPSSVKGAVLDPPYEDERYLDIRSTTVAQLIIKRMDVAKNKGCQGIEPDIDDAYFEDFEGNYAATSTHTGFPITYKNQRDYSIKLAKAAHARGMSYGLKNGADAKYVKDLLPYIDWVLSEQCYEYGTCSVYKPVIAAGKAVFDVEYSGSAKAFCPALNKLNFDTLKKDPELNALPRARCRVN